MPSQTYSRQFPYALIPNLTSPLTHFPSIPYSHFSISSHLTYPSSLCMLPVPARPLCSVSPCSVPRIRHISIIFAYINSVIPDLPPTRSGVNSLSCLCSYRLETALLIPFLSPLPETAAALTSRRSVAVSLSHRRLHLPHSRQRSHRPTAHSAYTALPVHIDHTPLTGPCHFLNVHSVTHHPPASSLTTCPHYHTFTLPPLISFVQTFLALLLSLLLT